MSGGLSKNLLSASRQLNAKGYRPAILLDCSCCTGCGLCVRMCPDLVIEIYKEKEMLNGGDKIWHAKF
jgi:2-oxoglutarate ferredoxin oxidoreductase subunit delta